MRRSAALLIAFAALACTAQTQVGSAGALTGDVIGTMSFSPATGAEITPEYGTFSLNASGPCTVGTLVLSCPSGVWVRVGVLFEASATCTVGGQVAVAVLELPIALLLWNQVPPAIITSALLVGVWVIATV